MHIKNYLASLAILLAFFLAASTLFTLAQTENSKKNDIDKLLTKPTPTAPDGHPDLSGVWTTPNVTGGLHLEFVVIDSKLHL